MPEIKKVYRSDFVEGPEGDKAYNDAIAENTKEAVNKFATNVKTFNTPSDKQYYNPLRNLRFLPVLGSAFSVLSDALGKTNVPDKSIAESIKNVPITQAKLERIGDYMKEVPGALDTAKGQAELNAQAASTLSNIMNTSSNAGQAQAASVAAGLNAQLAQGNFARQVAEYRLKELGTRLGFNRGTNIFNAQQGATEAQLNNNNSRLGLQAAMSAGQIYANELARTSAARSANLTNLFDNLGDVGREAYAMDMIRNNKALLYDWFGAYKNYLNDIAQGKQVQASQAAKGGYLTIKTKKRR